MKAEKVRRCGVAFGSNLGDRLENLRAARKLLAERVSADGLISSPVFETAPVGCAEGTPPFLNAVVELGTLLEPEALLEVTQGIERELGRPDDHGVNAPRTVDLDILFVGDLSVSSENLVVPHPRMAERSFVLEPLSRIRPDLRVRGHGATVGEILGELGGEPLVEVAGSDWEVIYMNAKQKLGRLVEMKKSGELICSLTAYDYPTGRLLDEAGIDMILVGDSLGMVVLGYEDTTSVTMDEMTHHLRAVRRGVKRAPLVADLPFNSYETVGQAVENARRLEGSGADAVKLEGGTAVREQVEGIVAAGIGFVGHIGMLPQHVREEGGYKKKGKTAEQAAALVQDARDLEMAGASAIVLEGVIPAVAAEITENSNIPTIGIGAGPDCDGQILVTPDLLGAFPWFCPAFAKPRADVAGETVRAVTEWSQWVREETGRKNGG